METDDPVKPLHDEPDFEDADPREQVESDQNNEEQPAPSHEDPSSDRGGEPGEPGS